MQNICIPELLAIKGVFIKVKFRLVLLEIEGLLCRGSEKEYNFPFIGTVPLLLIIEGAK